MKNNSGPAFPSHGTMGEVNHEGMSLRDYFAAKALPIIFRNNPESLYALVVKDSYAIADAMLKEREI